MTTLTTEDEIIDKDEVLKMAKDAGLRQHIPFWSDSEVADALEAFAKLVADVATAKEREACAQTVLNIAGFKEYEFAANSIRARGEA